MRRALSLLVVALIGCTSHAQDARLGRVDWKWLIQYSYRQPQRDGGYQEIILQMYDDGRVQYIRWPDPPADPHGNSAWSRELKMTSKEAEDIKKRIEKVLSEPDDHQEKPKGNSREFSAHITIRTSEELQAVLSDKTLDDPHKQTKAIFKNLHELTDETHKKIQGVLKRFNDESEKLPWKWQ